MQQQQEGAPLLLWRRASRYPSTTYLQAIHPCVQVSANFGADLAARPFRGDVAWIKAEAAQRLYSSILHTTVPRGAKASAGWLAGTAPRGWHAVRSCSGPPGIRVPGWRRPACRWRSCSPHAMPCLQGQGVTGELVFGYLQHHG